MKKRKPYFTFRISDEERKLLELLAEKLERSQSDIIRLMIRHAAKEYDRPDDID